MKVFAVLLAILASSSVSGSATELIEAVTSGDALFFDLDPAFGAVERRVERGKAPKIDATITTTGGYTLTTSINERNIWENAKIAKSLGFGTILIDGGWDTPGGDCIGYDTTYGGPRRYR